jgi:hypothetical protein
MRVALTGMEAQAEKDREAMRVALTGMEAQAEKDRETTRVALTGIEAQAEKDRETTRVALVGIEAQAEKDREAMRVALTGMEAQAEKDREAMRVTLTDMEAQAEKNRQQAQQERRELARQLGDIAHRIGTVVEDVIAPSLRRLAQEELGCGAERFFAVRLSKGRNDEPGRHREFDALYVGERAILLNESKATARPEYAQNFVAFLRSGEFFLDFPEYRDIPVLPVFSSLYLPADLVTYLTRQGIYAVAMGDEAMEVLNLEQIRASSSRGADTHK